MAAKTSAVIAPRIAPRLEATDSLTHHEPTDSLAHHARSAASLSACLANSRVMPGLSVAPEVVAADRAAPEVIAPEVIAPEVSPPDVAAPKVAATGVAAARLAAPNVAVAGGVVSGVMVQLALLVEAGSGGLSGVDSEGALRVVEAAEAVKAWADSVSVAAVAVMVTEFESDFVDLAPEEPSRWGWTRFVRSCRSAAAREIQVATGLPITWCQRRVWLAACEPERTAALLEAMGAGQVSYARALTLTEATAELDGLTAAAIAARVLRPRSGPDGVPLPGMAPLSQATFSARLRTQLVLAHGLVGEAERTYALGLAGRRCTAEAHHDGTGALFISGDGPRISAAAGRVDRIAARLRKDGDARTLAQLRADVATDLLLAGWVPSDPTFARLGKPPAATVHVVVSLATLLGVDAGVGHIPGWGALGAQQTRDLALQKGSVWTRIVSDPLTGRAIEATARPTASRQPWPDRSTPATGPAARPGARSRPNAPTWTTPPNGPRPHPTPPRPAEPRPRPTWQPCTADTTT